MAQGSTGVKPAAASERQERERFVALVGQHLERLQAFVGHEIRYFQSVGDLVPGGVTVDDVVEALVETLRSRRIR